MSNSSSTPRPLRFAMLGMIPGNGHPYSWSAIFNGFDPVAMTRCPYPVIPKYLGAQPAGTVKIDGARITHLWTDNPAEAPDVAAASLIPNVVAKPEDVIGQVDGVIIATDDGFDHVKRSRAFVEAGLPVFVDKPLATSLEDLKTFIAWEKQGVKVLSSSGLRYAPELDTCLANLPALGDLRWLSGLSCKTWERYGIHLLEPLYRIVGPGLVSVRLETAPGIEVAHIVHKSGVQLTLPVIYDGGPTFGQMHVCGTAGQTLFKFADTYTGFRRQMVSYVDYVRMGVAPYPFAETVELMVALIAGLRSRAENSRRVELAEIYSQL